MASAELCPNSGAQFFGRGETASCGLCGLDLTLRINTAGKFFPVHGRKANKYGVAPSAERTVDGITFASKAEARRYGELRLLEKAGEIAALRRQLRFALWVVGDENGLRYPVGHYVCDFAYTAPTGFVVEDVKGVRTPVYRLKKKLFEGIYGVKITEIAVEKKKPYRPRRSKSSRVIG